MNEPLKACPFCGEANPSVSPAMLQDGTKRPYIGCGACGAMSSDFPTEAEAVAAWNRRAWPSEKALAQLRDALDEARAIVDVGEQRALAADGPVGHCREELSNAEFDRMWHAVERARAVLALLNGGTR